MRLVVGEYKTAILAIARFEAVPGLGTDPEHTRHYLMNSVTHPHKTVYQLLDQ
jgi:hypothetical protein